MLLRACLVVWTLVAYLHTGECDSAHHVNQWIARASCQARCLRKYGEPHQDSIGDSSSFRPYTCNTEDCKQCSMPCDWKLLGEGRCKDDCVNKKCGHSCLVLYKTLTNLRRTTLHGNGILGTEHLRDTEDLIQLDGPEVVCKDTSLDSLADGQYLSEIYVRWKVTATKRIPDVAAVFVLALRRRRPDGHHSHWTIIGKTPYLVFHIKHLASGDEYQLRVTPVSGAGYAGKDVISHWMTTLPAGSIGEPPLSIHLIDQKVDHQNLITATLEWSTAKDPSCYFKVIWSSDRNDGYKEIFMTQPQPSNRLTIEGLYFKRNYTLRMRAFSRDFQKEGGTTDVKFATNSCLDATGNDFDKCAPGPSLLTRYGHLSGDKHGHVIRITWIPPRYTSTSNRVTGYIVEWKKIATHAKPLVKPHDGWTELPGNVNGLVMTSLHKDSVYEVQVRTKSAGGIGQPVFLIVRTRGRTGSFERQRGTAYVNDTVSPDQSHVAVHLDIPWEVYLLIIPVVLILLVLIIRAYLRRLRLRKTRGFTKRWTNMQELNPLYTSAVTHFDKGTGLLPCDKYEISWTSLKFREVIGEGRFCIVKTALLIQPGGGYCQSTTTKEVAVEMLKDKSNETDCSNLLKEIGVLKQLGSHQNIAGIVGCCTTWPHPCLVIDYCPLGDLRSYLRRICKKTFGRHTSSFSEDSGIVSPRRATGHERSESISREFKGDNITSACPLLLKEDELSESQLLSYASQIANGMVHISSRGVVHGSLSASNVLMSDARTVKISGFGFATCAPDQHTGPPSQISPLRAEHKWLSPEAMVIDQRAFTTNTDVWAFGVTFWELLSLGASPYPGITYAELPSMLSNGYRLEKPESCSNASYHLMLKCWHADPESRPTFPEIRDEIYDIIERSHSNIHMGNALISGISSTNVSDLILSSNTPQPVTRRIGTNKGTSSVIISPRAASLDHYAPTMAAILDMDDWSSDELTN